MSNHIVRGADAPSYTTSPTDTMRFLAIGGDGTPDITDELLAPGDGPPLHRHPWASWEVVVEGEVLVRIGDDEVVAGPGDLVHTPPNVPHTFVAIGSSPARMIGMHLPGGFHGMYAEIAGAFATDGPPDFGAMAAAAAKHDAEILGPPLSVPGR